MKMLTKCLIIGIFCSLGFAASASQTANIAKTKGHCIPFSLKGPSGEILIPNPDGIEIKMVIEVWRDGPLSVNCGSNTFDIKPRNSALCSTKGNIRLSVAEWESTGQYCIIK